jgi:hypothetical protein
MFTAKNRIEKKTSSVCGMIGIAATAVTGIAMAVLWLKALSDPKQHYTKRFKTRKKAPGA